MRKTRIKKFTLAQRKEMIRLYVEENVKPSEIARVFNTGMNCVKYHLTRANVYKNRWTTEKKNKCSKCGKKLPKDNFRWGAICGACNRKYARELVLRNEYNLSKREYKELLIEQDSVCAICGKNPVDNGKSLAVDHDHKTGGVRGLLCSTCNLGIGSFRDDIDIMIKAIDYIKRFQ